MTGLFLVATKTGQGRKFYVETGHALSRQKELLVRRFHVTTEHGGSRRFSVATGLFVSRQRLS